MPSSGYTIKQLATALDEVMDFAGELFNGGSDDPDLQAWYEHVRAGVETWEDELFCADPHVQYVSQPHSQVFVPSWFPDCHWEQVQVDEPGVLRALSERERLLWFYWCLVDTASSELWDSAVDMRRRTECLYGAMDRLHDTMRNWPEHWPHPTREDITVEWCGAFDGLDREDSRSR